MQTTVRSPQVDIKISEPPTIPTARRSPPVAGESVRRPFDQDAARQRFTAVVASIALVLSIVAVSRSTGTPADAEEELVSVGVSLETTAVDPPPNGLFGKWEFRGGVGLAGVSSETGVGTILGTYWVKEPGGTLRGDAIAHGRLLDISSTDYDQVYRLDLSSGDVISALPASGRVTVAAATGRLDPALGETPVPMTVYVDELGTVYGRAAEGSVAWSNALAEAVTAPPVIAGGEAVVVTRSGRVYGFNADGPTWTFPAHETTEPISVSPAFEDGIWYVADDGGTVHLINRATGSSCSRSLGLPPVGNPVVADGLVYLQSIGQLATFPSTECSGGLKIVPSAVDTSNSIAVRNGVVFTTDGQLLFPFRPSEITGQSLESGRPLGVWNGPFVAGTDITTAPVVAGGLVYIGTRDGLVFAVDEFTGDELWRFDADVATGADIAIQGSVVVLDGAVIVTTSGGHVIAIAGISPETPPEGGTHSSMR